MKGCISIGSHYGEEYEGWVSQGVKNFIFFEPVMANFVKLERILKDKNGYILLFNLAMGNKEGTVKMFTEQSHQGKSCSILKPTGHLKQYPDIEYGTQELVRISKLDSIPYDRDLYDHLHIDTQGYELEVLKGAAESLKHIDTLTIEVYREELYEGCAMVDDVVKYLKDFALMEIFWRGNTWGDAKFKRI
jgi:FkbM family methyltransferase